MSHTMFYHGYKMWGGQGWRIDRLVLHHKRWVLWNTYTFRTGAEMLKAMEEF